MMDHRSGGICRGCEEPDDIAEKLRMELGIKLINDPQTPLLQGHQDNRERGKQLAETHLIFQRHLFGDVFLFAIFKEVSVVWLVLVLKESQSK